jgi:Protein of unknown function DUF86
MGRPSCLVVHSSDGATPSPPPPHRIYELAIQRATEYIDRLGSVSALRQSQRDHDAVIRNIEIIGEAARQIQLHAPEFEKLISKGDEQPMPDTPQPTTAAEEDGMLAHPDAVEAIARAAFARAKRAALDALDARGVPTYGADARGRIVVHQPKAGKTSADPA